ncbi:MAG: P-II family nitrogen regulator [Balneola sp.]|jgi:nitrogen regulatory protein PII|nr:transcriptional regulator [Bacteroidota bacterium]MBO6620386.1 P-II family nitrogen regulator [Balneola sp.]MBO6649500.1 P-II family nitrogen regulator [Balneola sp.]MBO6711316.1 P-II family nitrogen regulator [Balneola sp.]MBO6800568.1 P-II family nitrogen regulator [Balneola sp.]|tara:strand:- start:930 stop:1271 length:342 start_codon:yes stop_codon:yes gene_type:complete
MKLIKAYIRPILLEDVYTALRAAGHFSITVFKGEGAGQYSDPAHEHGSLDFPAMHSRVIKIEIAAQQASVQPIIEIIQEIASTGSSGDGIIFVSPIEYALRIRDGKEGPEVLL